MMKKPLYAALAIGVLLSACSVSQNASKSYDDDIYYSSKDPKAPAEKKKDPVASSNEDLDGRSMKQQDDEGNTYITNNYYEDDFDYDDYYDYEYASRIRRFHNPCYGLSYYDNYYTNSYWYSYNPYHYGLSIYLGYNWWGPSYYTYSYYPGYYWGQYPSYWHWNNPYAYWGNPYYNGYSYWNGYNQGYWHGYNDGMWNNYYNNYYFNSYDNNSYYYGPRFSAMGTGSNGSPVASHSTLGEKYMEAIALESKDVPKDMTPDNKTVKGKTAGKEMSTGSGKTASAGEDQLLERPKTIQNAGTVKEENGYSKPSDKDTYERPAYYHNRNEYNEPSNSQSKDNYESPAYEKPGYNDSYNKPGNNNSYSRPGNDHYEAPKQDPPSYSRPRNENYSAPKKDTYSAPKSEPRNNNSAPRYNNGGSQQKSAPTNAPRKR